MVHTFAPFLTPRQVGRTVVLPLIFHSAIALLVSVLIYPTTMSAHFTNSLHSLLSPLISALGQHQLILTSSPHTPEFASSASQINDTISDADRLMAPLVAAARLLPSDLIYGRYAPGDFVAFQTFARRITGRANGMGVYFSIIDPTRQRFPVTPANSAPGTPVLSPTPTRQQSRAPSRMASRAPSPDGRGTPELAASTTTRGRPLILPSPSAQSVRSGSPRAGSHSRQGLHINLHLHKHVHHKLRHYAFHPRTPRFENAVGVFESQRYLNLEATRFHDANGEMYTAQTTEDLSLSCQDVLEGCRTGLVAIQGWLGGVRGGRLQYFLQTKGTLARWEKEIAEHEKIRDKLAAVLEKFREVDRHRVLDPYRPAFDLGNDPTTEHDIPAHRYLFQAYVYQYHLIQFAAIVIEMLDEMIRLEKERSTQRLWTPVKRLITWNNWQISESAAQGNENDEDPDTILGVSPNVMEDLGMPQRRDPDALPPRNIFESVMGVLYYSVTGLSGGNILFAIKAGILTVLLALPSLLSSSAFFAYENRFVWGL
ncbi:hypothetical protein DXG03_008356 [Asterophora parasitica]|uniref:Putative ER transporter 6TM N-terminal domain-containing protein n=1 Tax=Asterophora parasitica TaxID=117018 RepID=A0A9P7GCD9_9AGAR|nr:hypothetical protein DXG03_008356 [Asterophora parasitica]